MQLHPRSTAPALDRIWPRFPLRRPKQQQLRHPQRQARRQRQRLGYKPEFPTHKVNYRHFLCKSASFHEQIVLHGASVQKKVHHTYRLQFLEDIVIIDIINHIQIDVRFLGKTVDIFSTRVLPSVSTDDDNGLGTPSAVKEKASMAIDVCTPSHRLHPAASRAPMIEKALTKQGWARTSGECAHGLKMAVRCLGQGFAPHRLNVPNLSDNNDARTIVTPHKAEHINEEGKDRLAEDRQR